MKRTNLLISIIICVAAMLGISDIYAQQILQSRTIIKNSEISRHRDSVTVSMQMDFTDTRIKSSSSIIITPRFSETNGKGSAYIPPVELIGRKRRIYLQRNPESVYTTDDMYCTVEKKHNEKQVVDYEVTLPYAEWMDHSRLQIIEDLCGCGKVESGNLSELTQADLTFHPHLAYVVPEAEPVKTRDLSGQSYLDFKVNRTEIDPSYRKNPVELKRIIASIDTVKNDKDFTITSIEIKGYASPEGSYASNTRLAKGRTASLKKYIMDKYGFEESTIKASSEPENWEGLVEYLESCSLSDKEQILEFIENGPDDIDQKERQMRTKFPASYAILLNDCYPSLRRTDYRIDYVIRSFKLEEAKALVKTAPQRLSLEELFAVAQTYEPGSEDFNQVFDVAVKMYPDDETANINAANALLEQGRATEALKYLDKVKSVSPEAENARGVAFILLKDYDKAEQHIAKALEGKLEEAAHNMEFLK